MRHAIPLTLRSELMRYQTIALLYRLTTKADELELPKPSMALTSARHQLEENRYNVLVVGEAKRGKSTFVNALIGQDILPTGVERAMTQAFRVCHAEQAAYRRRFEDGSQQEIPADALFQYGAHVVEDSAGKPRLGQSMRCIEVEVPMPFLPEGVSIWDTPGLGSHRATQTHIIQRFVPHADAVIYVLDSRQPMDQSDLEFMEALVTQKSSEARAEVARMVADAPLDDEQRHVKAQQLEQQVADWDSIGTTIQNIMAGLEALEHSL